jgi:GNAT superfamily N-acetyltransferase
MGYEIEIARGSIGELFEFADRIPELGHEGAFETCRKPFVNFYADKVKVGGASYSTVYMNNAAPGSLILLFGIFTEYRKIGLGRLCLATLEDFFREKQDAIFIQAVPPATQRAYYFYLANGYEQTDGMLFKWLQPRKFASMRAR